MTFLPIVERELRLAARRHRTYWIRLGAGALGSMTVLGMLLPALRGLQSPAGSGEQIFLLLAGVAFAFCLFAGAFLTADSLSEEKREGTLGLLFLTQMKGRDVVLGKLLATGLNPFYGFLAVVPLLGFPILLGGVAAGEFCRMTLVLINTLFFSLAAGLLISALSVDGRKAVASTLLLIVLITALPLLNVATGNIIGTRWSWLSPACGAWLAFETPFAAAPRGYWNSVFSTHLFGWLCLIFASRQITRTFQDRPDQFCRPTATAARSRSRPPRNVRMDSATDAGQAMGRIENHPALWLAQRQKQRLPLFWSLVCLLGAGWLFASARFPGFWLRPEVIFAVTFAVHSVIKCWIALEASRGFAMGRRSGELELLLVTPLSVEELVKGRMLGLKRQFLAPVTLVLVWDLVLVFFMKSPAWGAWQNWALAFLVAIPVFLIDSYTLSWTGLWQGLCARHTTQAFVRTLGLVLVLPWLIFLATAAMIGVFLVANEWVFGWWLLVCLTNAVALCAWSNTRLLEEFRDAASQRVSPT